MERDSKVLPFIVALIASFTVGNSLISAPFYKKSLFPFFAAIILWLIVTAVYIAVQNRITLKTGNIFIKRTIYIVIALLAVSVSALAFREYTGFTYGAMLVRADMWVIKLVFAPCVFFLAVSGHKAIFKFSFLSLTLSGMVFIILFFLSAKTFDLRHLKDALSFSGFSFRDTAGYFVKMFLPGLISFVFIKQYYGKISMLTAEIGVISGAFLCLLVIFDSVLSFGLPFAARLKFPYISDISTVTVGSLFTRMDGFAYFAFFACYLTKCGICISLAADLISRKHRKTAALILSALLIFI